MFSGIIEEVGTVVKVEPEGDNLHLFVSCSFLKEIRIDQSIAHQGACLTVVELSEAYYKVTAIKETLLKTNLSTLKAGSKVNLERCLTWGGRIDGHLVQGHVDQTGTCVEIKQEAGSWVYTFTYDLLSGNLAVEKGSITLNGISLTVFHCIDNRFSVAIIPYTYEHTTMPQVRVGDVVNLEFDIIGKYVSRYMQAMQK